MSDKKRSKRRKDEYVGPGEVEVEKPAKEEFAVAKWMRKNVPTKKTKFLNHNVEYFNASKALDALMSSKFAQPNSSLFATREDAVEFLDAMLVHKFFHRAKKVPVTPEELKGKTKKPDKIEKEEKPRKDAKKEKPKEEKTKEEKITDAESSHVEGKVDKAEKEKEKRKRKIRLDMHPDQVFVDGSEAYVWIYDPIPMHYWVFGATLVFGAIVICLFPLWPPILRKGVYYLSIAAAGFLVFILGLTVLRFIIFLIVWVLTGSKHHFWIFPNLTEDVGFLASFWPLYHHEYRDGSDTNKSNKKPKKKKKDKDSDAEDEGETPLLEPEKIENIKEHDVDILQEHPVSEKQPILSETSEEKSKAKDESPDRKNSVTPSESESESSQRSSTGKDFEIVDSAEVDTS